MQTWGQLSFPEIKNEWNRDVGNPDILGKNLNVYSFCSLKQNINHLEALPWLLVLLRQLWSQVREASVFVSGVSSYFSHFSLTFFKYKLDLIFPLLYSSMASYFTKNKIKIPNMTSKNLKDAPCLPLLPHFPPFSPLLTVSQTQYSGSS